MECLGTEAQHSRPNLRLQLKKLRCERFFVAQPDRSVPLLVRSLFLDGFLSAIGSKPFDFHHYAWDDYPQPPHAPQ